MIPGFWERESAKKFVGIIRIERHGEIMYQKKSYILAAIGIAAAILLGDYIVYCVTVNRMEQMQEDYEKRISEQIEVNMTTQLEDKAAEVVQRAVEKEWDSILASADKDTLQVDTVYQIQSYDANSETIATDYETLPEELVGLTREEADAYCKTYMDRLPVEEYLNGLQSMGVVSFASDRLVVKKIYDSSKVKFRYYLIAVDGEVVVYYGDKKTVYEYTGIETKRLSKEEKKMLKKGLEVKDEEELYSILENYSS